MTKKDKKLDTMLFCPMQARLMLSLPNESSPDDKLAQYLLLT